MQPFSPENLEISKFKDEILKKIEKNRVTIIKGPTGCGKSTYVPKILLDKCKGCEKVALIQPRRIAVLGLFNTMKKYVDNLGYKMRYDYLKIEKNRTGVMIYTDGMFLNELIHCKKSSQYKYIIIDEVHERNLRIDIILSILKKSHILNNSKLILMSATIDITALKNFINAEIVEISTQTYKARIFYEPRPVSNYLVAAYMKIKQILDLQNRFHILSQKKEEELNADPFNICERCFLEVLKLLENFILFFNTVFTETMEKDNTKIFSREIKDQPKFHDFIKKTNLTLLKGVLLKLRDHEKKLIDESGLFKILMFYENRNVFCNNVDFAQKETDLATQFEYLENYSDKVSIMNNKKPDQNILKTENVSCLLKSDEQKPLGYSNIYLDNQFIQNRNCCARFIRPYFMQEQKISKSCYDSRKNKKKGDQTNGSKSTAVSNENHKIKKESIYDSDYKIYKLKIPEKNSYRDYSFKNPEESCKKFDYLKEESEIKSTGNKQPDSGLSLFIFDHFLKIFVIFSTINILENLDEFAEIQNEIDKIFCSFLRNEINHAENRCMFCFYPIHDVFEYMKKKSFNSTNRTGFLKNIHKQNRNKIYLAHNESNLVLKNHSENPENNKTMHFNDITLSDQIDINNSEYRSCSFTSLLSRILYNQCNFQEIMKYFVTEHAEIKNKKDFNKSLQNKQILNIIRKYFNVRKRSYHKTPSFEELSEKNSKQSKFPSKNEPARPLFFIKDDRKKSDRFIGFVDKSSLIKKNLNSESFCRNKTEIFENIEAKTNIFSYSEADSNLRFHICGFFIIYNLIRRNYHLEESKKTNLDKKFTQSKFQTGYINKNKAEKIHGDFLSKEILRFSKKSDPMLSINVDANVLGDILVFLPGEQDIHEFYSMINTTPQVYPLKIFGAAKNTEVFTLSEKRPSQTIVVYISTNICETSLTLPNVKYVIDSGLKKEKFTKKNVNYLIQTEVSTENAEQRMGRCNRISDGFCFRLFTVKKFHELKRQKSEIEISDIKYLLLSLYSVGLNPLTFNYPSKPSFPNLLHGLEFLKRIGCLSMHSTNGYDITEYGREILSIPIDISLAHFFFNSCKLKIPYLGAIISAFLSIDNYNFIDNQHGEVCDLLFLVNLFRDFLDSKDREFFCKKRKISHIYMNSVKLIFDGLMNMEGLKTIYYEQDSQTNIFVLENCFSESFKHNTGYRTSDGSYRILQDEIELWIHPSSFWFRKKPQKIVFYDIFNSSKMYARFVSIAR